MHVFQFPLESLQIKAMFVNDQFSSSLCDEVCRGLGMGTAKYQQSSYPGPVVHAYFGLNGATLRSATLIFFIPSTFKFESTTASLSVEMPIVAVDERCQKGPAATSMNAYEWLDYLNRSI
jgi:hypothetical protein